MEKSQSSSGHPATTSSTEHLAHIKNKPFYFAFVETVLFLSVLVGINAYLGDGDRFITMSLHPFWIIVLLVTFQYGPREALMAAVLASLFLLVGNIPEQNLTEVVYEYILRVVYLPFLWIATALALGSLRFRQIREKQSLQEGLETAEKAKDEIAKAYKLLKQTKEMLELRLAEEKCSVLTVYNIAKSLETINPADAIAEIMKLVQLSLKPTKFSLYRYEGNGLFLEICHGWEDGAMQYAREFGNANPLTASIVGQKRMLTVANEEDEVILDSQGMLAGPIIDESTGLIFGMLKIEEIAFMDMGIRSHETFRIVCEWIGRICANIEKYQSLQGHLIRREAKPHNKKKKLHFLNNIKPQIFYSRSVLTALGGEAVCQ